MPELGLRPYIEEPNIDSDKFAVRKMFNEEATLCIRRDHNYPNTFYVKFKTFHIYQKIQQNEKWK